MPTPQHVRDAAIKRRERTCPVCGKFFIASRPSAKGICSPECQRINYSRVTTGQRKHSAETRAKMSESGKQWRKDHPDWEKRRAEAAKAASQSEEYRSAAFERWQKMQESGTGICSDEIRTANAERSKWVMRRAREELECDTEFVTVWSETLDRLRMEYPYDGPQGTSDYFDYCKKIGKLMCADPSLRKLQDDFMREAIPRAGLAWDKLEGE